MKNLAILLLSISLGPANTINPKTNQELFSVSVMIMSPDESGGGSGVILESKPSGSEILTNRHVCEGVSPLGVVVDSAHMKYPITGMILDDAHDLCLIKVSHNFNLSIELSPSTPAPADELIIVGHPRLLPTIITRGHFSDTIVVPIQDGGRVVMREATVASALISPGSSGSPVFNDKGQLAGLVFAGSQGLSYGLLVPLHAIKTFVLRSHIIDLAI